MVVVQDARELPTTRSRVKAAASTSGLSRVEQSVHPLLAQRGQNADESADVIAITEERDRQLRDEHHSSLDGNGISAEQLSFEEYCSERLAAADHRDSGQN